MGIRFTSPKTSGAIRAILSLTVLLASVLLASNGSEFAGIRADSGFTIPADPVLPDRESHPSLWFSSSDIDELRAKKDRDDFAAQLWIQLSESPYLTDLFPPAVGLDSGTKSIHKYYGDMSRRAKNNAFFYLLEQNPEKRQAYRKRALEALLRAYDGPIYSFDPNIKGGPVDEIYRAIWAQNFCAAYDWVFNSLGASENLKIRKLLAREAKFLYENLYSFVDQRPHNHLSKPAWGLGTLALTLSGHPDASVWLGRAIEASNKNTRNYFTKDGIYREGSHYMIFSFINYMPFLYHYRNVSGVNAFQHFQPAMEWPILVRNGRGWMPNIEDSYIRPFPSHMVVEPYLNSKTRLHSTATLGQILHWNFLHTDYQPFERSLARTGFNYTGASWDYTKILDEYLTYQTAVEPVAPEGSPTVFLESGQTVFRNGWTSDKPGFRFLLFQGVAEAENHQHADHLSFIIEAGNQLMASDSGYSRRSYGEAIRTSWYKTAKAHNVVTIDGQAPIDVAPDVTPASRHQIDTSFFDFEEKEAPYPQGGKLVRAVAFPGEEYFVIVDQVFAEKKSRITLYLHGGRGNTTGEKHYRKWQYSEDEYGESASLSAWFLFSKGEIHDRLGEVTYIKGDYARYPYVEISSIGRETTFMQILFPQTHKEAPPTVTDLTDESRLGAVVDFGPVQDTILLQLRPSVQTVASLETDATFAMVRESESGGISWVSARQVTSLSYGNRKLLASTIPITLALQFPHGEKWDGFTGQVSAAGSYTLEVGGEFFPTASITAVFNGVTVPVSLSRSGHIQISLKGSGSLRLETSAP